MGMPASASHVPPDGCEKTYGRRHVATQKGGPARNPDGGPAGPRLVRTKMLHVCGSIHCITMILPAPAFFTRKKVVFPAATGCYTVSRDVLYPQLRCAVNQMALLKQYLKDREDTEIPDSGFPFVTISRQAGAGGHTLARKVLQEMDKYPDDELLQGWEMFDEKLCAVVAQDNAMSSSFESLVREEYKPALHQVIYDMLIGHSEQFSTYKKIFEVVRILGMIGKVLIIGRAGAFVTAGMPKGIHLRLVADERKRMTWAMPRFEMKEDLALAAIRKQDKDRERMVRDFFGKDLKDPVHYDVVFNTARQDLDAMARIIVQMIRARATQAPS